MQLCKTVVIVRARMALCVGGLSRPRENMVGVNMALAEDHQHTLK